MGAIRTIVPSTEYPSLFARRMISSAWSQGTSRSATSTVPCTFGSITMLRPLISAKLRSTARRSAPWKSRLIGFPVNRVGPWLAAPWLWGWANEPWTGACAGACESRALLTVTAGTPVVCRATGAVRPSAAIGSIAGVCASARAFMASGASPLTVLGSTATGSTYGFPVGLSRSITTVLRSLRT